MIGAVRGTGSKWAIGEMCSGSEEGSYIRLRLCMSNKDGSYLRLMDF